MRATKGMQFLDPCSPLYNSAGQPHGEMGVYDGLLVLEVYS